MAEPDATALESATAAAAPEPKGRDAKSWLDEIQQAEKDMSEWCTRAKKIERIWLEERDEAKKFTRQYALLWANISVLQPAVYAKQPQPVVTRRFSDRDPVARNVADVMERSLITIFDHGDIDTCLKSVRDNFLVVGRGTAWVRYEPKFETKEFDLGDGEVEEVETLADETLAFDFVHWADFIHPKVRRWEDMPWVGRKVYLDKETLEARFGKKKADAVFASYMVQNPGEYAKAKPKDKPCIYEIWSKRDKQVIWIAKDYKEDFLDKKDPLYDLRGFFPCPKPAYGTLPTDCLKPVPDYVYYQDQAEEINTLTAKIGALEDALKLVGFYPAAAEGGISAAIEKALSPSASNEMIPVPAWAAFVQGGGSKQMIEWLPMDMVLAVLQGCVELRKALIEDVFQITGISDIVRGATDPRETKGAQQIKAQWGSIRIRDRQAEMARFSRDLTRIAAEIVAEKFQPETLWQLSGLKFPTQADKQQAQMQIQAMQQQMQMRAAQMAQQAPQGAQGMPAQPMPQPAPAPQQTPQMPPLPPEIEEMMQKPTQEELVGLMKDDRLRSYRIDIETDSTIIADEQAEKESRTEFVTMLGGLISQALPVVQQVPELAPVVGQSLLFVTRAFRAGRQLEDTIEQAVEAITKKAAGAGQQPPPPDPKMEKIKVDKELGTAKLQITAQDNQAKNQIKAQEIAAKTELGNREIMADVLLEREKMQARTAEQIARATQPNQGFPV
jgi:hypothetical protein